MIAGWLLIIINKKNIGSLVQIIVYILDVSNAQ